MKRKPLLAALAIVVLLVAVSSTLAYFTSKDKKDNVFAMGNVNVKLTEPSWDETQEHLFFPGAEYDKDPTVENTGNMDAYIRVHVTLSDYDVLAAENPDYDYSQMFEGIDSEKWTSTGEGVKKDGKITYSYFYNTYLPKGESTGALFTKVRVPTFITEKVKESITGDISVVVNADAIQKEGFENPQDAFAAFDEQRSN